MFDEPAKARFEDDVRIFMSEQVITGTAGKEVTDEAQLLHFRQGFRHGLSLVAALDFDPDVGQCAIAKTIDICYRRDANQPLFLHALDACADSTFCNPQGVGYLTITRPGVT